MNLHHQRIPYACAGLKLETLVLERAATVERCALLPSTLSYLLVQLSHMHHDARFHPTE